MQSSCWIIVCMSLRIEQRGRAHSLLPCASPGVYSAAVQACSHAMAGSLLRCSCWPFQLLSLWLALANTRSTKYLPFLRPIGHLQTFPLSGTSYTQL